jgi:hypothetical protein
MHSGDTIKTTVRLPIELNWGFQGERAKRRLSNEKAVCEAFAAWIAQPSTLAGTRNSLRRNLPVTPVERKYVETVLHILRDRENTGRAAALTALLGAFSNTPRAGNARRPVAVMPRRVINGKKA